MFAYWWAVLVYGIIFGVVTNIVIKNKGYEENWFWWGFFFGVFALIVACTKPSKVAVAGVAQTTAVDSSIPQAIGLEKDYDTLYTIPERQYSIGSPVVIKEGKLLKEKETGRIFARCNFQIVTDKKIKAAFVSVLEYDVAGDFLGETKTQYLDLERETDLYFGSKKYISLSNDFTRKIEVKCTKVIFEDDTRWDATDEWKPLPKRVALEDSFGLDLVKQYQLETNSSAKYEPQNVDQLWICSCGSANCKNNTSCLACGVAEAVVFEKFDHQFLQEKSDARVAKEAADAKAAQEQAAAITLQKQTAAKKKRILAVVVAVVLFVSVGLFVRSSNIKKEQERLAKIDRYISSGVLEGRYWRSTHSKGMEGEEINILPGGLYTIVNYTFYVGEDDVTTDWGGYSLEFERSAAGEDVYLILGRRKFKYDPSESIWGDDYLLEVGSYRKFKKAD